MKTKKSNGVSVKTKNEATRNAGTNIGFPVFLLSLLVIGNANAPE
jgi:hypothetical protein